MYKAGIIWAIVEKVDKVPPIDNQYKVRQKLKMYEYS